MTGQQRPARLLRRLARVNRTGVFLATLAVAVLGLLLPGVIGSLIIYAVVAALAVLLSVTWPVTPPAMRLARLAILTLLAVIATIKITG